MFMDSLFLFIFWFEDNDLKIVNWYDISMASEEKESMTTISYSTFDNYRLQILSTYLKVDFDMKGLDYFCIFVDMIDWDL